MPLQIPTSMFWGLPVTDSTDPTLAPIARPRRYGVGRTRIGASAAISTGVTTKHTVSLTNSAESNPPPIGGPRAVQDPIGGPLEELRLFEVVDDKHQTEE